MRATGDAQTQTWSATGALPSFNLFGGSYQVMAHSGNWNGGNVALQQLQLDGVTWVGMTGVQGTTATTSITADTVEFTIQLAPGTYRFNVTTTTAGTVNICRVPSD